LARTIAKDHGEKRDGILKSAARVFANEGLARASMSRLASECGISKANIYHYYDNKDELLYVILDTYLVTLHKRVYGLPLEGLAAEQKLRLVVSEMLIAYEGMDHEHKILLEGLPLLPTEQQEILRNYQRQIVQLLSGILQEIAPMVFVDDPVKLRSATMSVFGMLNWFYTWNKKADRTARENYAELVATIAINGIKGL
jgi:AcrR family transcriptional regulator